MIIETTLKALQGLPKALRHRTVLLLGAFILALSVVGQTAIAADTTNLQNFIAAGNVSSAGAEVARLLADSPEDAAQVADLLIAAAENASASNPGLADSYLALAHDALAVLAVGDPVSAGSRIAQALGVCDRLEAEGCSPILQRELQQLAEAIQTAIAILLAEAFIENPNTASSIEP